MLIEAYENYFQLDIIRSKLSNDMAKIFIPIKEKHETDGNS